MECLCFPADYMERYKKKQQSDSFHVESKEEFTSDKLINNMCVCVAVSYYLIL